MRPRKMLAILLGLSFVKAALIIGYFMHLKYEVTSMKWLTMCSVVACLILMTIFFFPDAFRILYLGVKLDFAPQCSSHCSFCGPRLHSARAVRCVTAPPKQPRRPDSGPSAKVPR